MADDFSKSVEEGFRLSKRLYYGKHHPVLPPLPAAMKKSRRTHLPTAPMVYAVISDPAVVDNPDIPSYQPYVHGLCDPPALIPLQMNDIAVQVDCYLDTALVSVSGSWRVHCVMGSRSCSCRIAVPMGEQGSILGVEVDVTTKSYGTRLITIEEKADILKVAKAKDGGFLKPHIFTLTIPEVNGGTNLSVKVVWSQKLSYKCGQFLLHVPFSFPEYVNPAGMKLPKREKIELNVNAGTGAEVLCKKTSHPLKEIRRQAGKLGFSYETNVLTWSSADFIFSYEVCSSDIHGSLFLQSPSIHDFDQREMFCLYLFPGNNKNRKVFRKGVVFVVDISASMLGRSLESVKNGLCAALYQLTPEDTFNIIAFNGETYLFSSSLERATKETIENASQWISINFVSRGGTNLLLPLNQAVDMLSNTFDLFPMIFLITDGSVEDERNICELMKAKLTSRESISPRISTFGIGLYCNHYFLQMLALIGRGHYGAAYDVDSIELQLQKLLTTASSPILSNVIIDALENLDTLEVYPYHLPDLLSGSPLTVSGRYKGNFPDTVTLGGILGDMSNLTIDLKVQKAKGIPLDKVFAKQQIGMLTAQAWFSESKPLEDKVAKMSLQTGIPSEYTCMVLLQTERGKHTSEPLGTGEVWYKIDLAKLMASKDCKINLLPSFGIGFGNLAATADNIPPGSAEVSLEPVDILVKAASNCCDILSNNCCCLFCIQTCSRLNDQCAIILSQLCTALSCFGCIECCSDVCCS